MVNQNRDIGAARLLVGGVRLATAREAGERSWTRCESGQNQDWTNHTEVVHRFTISGIIKGVLRKV